MITLDKLSLSVPCGLIRWSGGQREYNSKYTGLPYHLIIVYSHTYRAYKIEFSAKVLRDRYPELINTYNIRDCLNAINAIGVCALDVESIIREAKVIGADFTKDIRIGDIPNVSNVKEVKSVIRLSINNYSRWNCANYKGGGIVVSNAVTDKRRRKRLTVYNKGYELGLSDNRHFLNSLQDSERLKEYFRERVRFELRATTQYQLKEWLGIENTDIMSVLTSTENPLRLVMSEMFNPIYAVEETEIKPTLTNLDKLSTLKLLEWDLSRVEAHVRESSKRSVREGMKPYERLYQAHRISKPMNIVDCIA